MPCVVAPIPVMLGLALLACTPAGPQVRATAAPSASAVTGAVTYRDRSALSPDAEIEVWIIDASPGMMIQSIVGRTTVRAAGRQVPIPFELRFDPARIEPTHPYELKAVITRGGETLYQTVQPHRVITQGNPVRVDVVVARGAPDAGAPAAPLEGTSWRLEDLGGAGVLDRVEATLEFRPEQRVAGKASCNRYSGSVRIDGASLTFSQMVSTRMACPPAVGDQEARYFKALEQATRYRVTGSTLLIDYRGSDKPLRFVLTGS